MEISRISEKGLTESRISEMEISSVKPHIRDHSYKVPTNRDFKRSKGLSISSKVRLLHSLHINHI